MKKLYIVLSVLSISFSFLHTSAAAEKKSTPKKTQGLDSMPGMSMDMSNSSTGEIKYPNLKIDGYSNIGYRYEKASKDVDQTVVLNPPHSGVVRAPEKLLDRKKLKEFLI